MQALRRLARGLPCLGDSQGLRRPGTGKVGFLRPEETLRLGRPGFVRLGLGRPGGARLGVRQPRDLIVAFDLRVG